MSDKIRVVKVSDLENEIISAIEQSPEGEQDIVWDPVYKALEILEEKSFYVEKK